MTTTALVAGSTGMLGNRIASHLLDQPDVAVRLLLRRSADDPKSQAADALVSRGAVAVIGDVTGPATLDPNTAGLIDLKGATATLWGTGDEPFNLTTVDDTARFTSRIATDPADLAGVRHPRARKPPSTRSSTRANASQPRL